MYESPTEHCEQTKADGSPCRASPRPGKRFCSFHDPELAGARARGRKAGGVRRSRRAAVLGPDAPDLPLATVADVVGLLGVTINQTRRGELDPRVANAVGYLAATLVKAIETGDLERRLQALEAQAGEQA
jgi:hypothetical protein